MSTTEEKKHEYWNHFMSVAFVDTGKKRGVPNGITPARLRVLKAKMWNDENFWSDVIHRHGGHRITPELMRQKSHSTYEHCQGNFWGMLVQIAVECQLIPLKLR